MDRRRGRHLNGRDDNSKGGFPVKALGVGVLVVFMICFTQFVLLTRHVEIIEPGGDPNSLRHRVLMHDVNLSVLEAHQHKLSVMTAQLSANLQREHNALVQVKEQLNGQISREQLLQAERSQGASGEQGLVNQDMLLEKQAREAQMSNELAEQRNTINTLTRTIDDVRLQMQEMARQEALTAEALRNQQASNAGGAAGASSFRDPSSSADSSRPRPEASDFPRNGPAYSGNTKFPARWLSRFSEAELASSAQEADKWMQGVKAMFKHTWKGYKERAYGQDEIRPVSGTPGRRWANCGLQILDSLSTMWVMGMKEEFDEAEQWVANQLRFDSPGLVSVFEITIRALGGLASAHALSGREVFLKKARELADRLLPAFMDEPPFPSTQVDMVTGQRKHGWYQGTILSEAGTLQLEFRYMSQMTGDPKYAEKADKSMNAVLEAAHGQGLVPWGLNKVGAPHFQNRHITFGAMGDSYYEYLLKVWIQTDKKENKYKDAWKQAMKEAGERLIRRTNGGLTYIAEENQGRANHKMDHLACFVGGMLVYGARVLPQAEVDQGWEKNAEGITETCYQMYHRQPSHLSPECVRLQPDAQAGQDMTVWNNAAHYLLRPEAAEAIFYMFYYTGDPKYRRMAGEIFEAIETHARTTFGYSAVKDVRSASPQQKNEMETFFVAETLKYLYLTFVPNPQAVVDLDEFVFTTEAHPIRIFRGASKSGFLNQGQMR